MLCHFPRVFRWVVLVGMRNLGGGWDPHGWHDCYLHFIASRVSLSQVRWWVVSITSLRVQTLSFHITPYYLRGSSRPPGIIHITCGHPSDGGKKIVFFFFFFREDFWQTRLREDHTSIMCLQRCVAVFWQCVFWLMGLSVKCILWLYRSDKGDNQVDHRCSFWLVIFLFFFFFFCFFNWTQCYVKEENVVNPHSLFVYVFVCLQGHFHQKTQLWTKMMFTEVLKSWRSKYTKNKSILFHILLHMISNKNKKLKKSGETNGLP